MIRQEKIINDSMKKEMPSEEYNLIEIHCFLALKQLMLMFHNRQISKESATLTKQQILAKYSNDCRQFEFEQSLYKEHVQRIMQTEFLRIKLRKLLNTRPFADEQAIAEVINVSLELITLYSGEEFV